MTTIIIPVYKYIKNKLSLIKKLGRRRGMNISSHEELGESAFALDPSKKELIVLTSGPKKSFFTVINLANVKKCTVVKKYRSIRAGEMKKKSLRDFIKSIRLNLEFNNNIAAVSLPLYKDRSKMAPEDAEAKAMQWQAVLSGLIQPQGAALVHDVRFESPLRIA